MRNNSLVKWPVTNSPGTNILFCLSSFVLCIFPAVLFLWLAVLHGSSKCHFAFFRPASLAIDCRVYGYFANVQFANVFTQCSRLKNEKFLFLLLCGIVIVKFKSVRHYCNIVQLILIKLQHYDLLWYVGEQAIGETTRWRNNQLPIVVVQD